MADPPPPTADQPTTKLIPEHVAAAASIYASARLEEMGLFAVMDAVADRFIAGRLPVGQGRAGDGLYDWIKGRSTRLSESERRGVYARVLGLPADDAPEVVPNTEFADLWKRFLAAVCDVVRQSSSEDLKGKAPDAEERRVSAEHARNAARALATNLSLFATGIAHPAAREMTELVRQVQGVLSDPEVLAHFGAKDMWQVVDQVSARELGRTANVTKYRTMAESGSAVLSWLAENADGLGDRSRAPDPGATEVELAEHAKRWLRAAEVEGEPCD